MNIILAIHPKYAKLIASGEKIVEIRKREFKHFPDWAYLYETAPTSAVVGRVQFGVCQSYVFDMIGSIGYGAWCSHPEKVPHPSEILSQACLTLDELKKYAGFNGRSTVFYCYTIKKVEMFQEPLKVDKYPQSFMYLGGDA